MMNFKQCAKRIPAVTKLLRRIKDSYEKNKRNRLNKEYRKTIDVISNADTLYSYIESLHNRIKNKERIKYYVISSQNTKLGICGYITFFLPHIAYAVAKGYVPVIDMQTFPNIYQSGDKRENTWELFFEQPFGVSLKDISPKNCINCPLDYWYSGTPHCNPMMDNSEISLWNSCFSALVRPNKRTMDYLNLEMRNILLDKNSTIGVIFRGTEYTQGHPVGHPIQPTPKMLAAKLEEMLSTGEYKKIYVASDEKGIVDYLRKTFPGKILINSRVYYDQVVGVDYSKVNEDHIGITAVKFDRDDDEYLRGVEYLSSINLVAHCGAFVAGGCGGTIAALYMNGLHFKERFVFELGRYGTDPIPIDE